MSEAVRSRILPALPGAISQGTIFQCACSETYSDCEVLGIVITARCDLANEKISSHTYLPLIPLESWLRRDFVAHLKRRILPSLLGEMRAALKSAGHSTSILESQSPRRILEMLFLPDETRDGKKRTSTMTKVVENFEAISDERLATGAIPPKGVGARFSSDSKRILQELVTQSLAGYYYLTCVEHLGQTGPHVVLLREIESVPAELMQRLARGLERAEYHDLCERHPGWRGRLRFGKSDFAEPLGTLRSPDVEHLLQCFSGLFARIGIADQFADEIENIQKRYIEV